jgi:hypothetical protein
MAEQSTSELPDHVAQYLLRRALSDIPQSVLDALAELSPEEVEVLDRLGASLHEAGVGPHSYTFLIH